MNYDIGRLRSDGLSPTRIQLGEEGTAVPGENKR